MSDSESNVEKPTQEPEATPKDKPKNQRRYCVIAKGLVANGIEEVIVNWGFTDKDEAKAAAAEYENTVNNAGAQATEGAEPPVRRCIASVAPEPVTYVIATLVTVEDGRYVLSNERKEVVTGLGAGGISDNAAWIVSLRKENKVVLYQHEAITLGKKIAIGAGCVLLVAGIAGGVAFGMGAFSPHEEQAREEAPITQTVEEEEREHTSTVIVSAAKEAEVKLIVTADGATSGTLKVIVTDNKDGAVVFEETEVVPNEEVILGKLPEGEYTLHVSEVPGRADGSTFRMPETDTIFTVGKDGRQVEVNVALEVLPLEETPAAPNNSTTDISSSSLQGNTSTFSTGEYNSPTYVDYPNYLYKSSTLFLNNFSFYPDNSVNERFDSAQSLAITDNYYVVFSIQWGVDDAHPRDGRFCVQVFTRASHSHLKTFYLPDTYDAATNSYVQNPAAPNHLHCGGSTYYAADGNIYVVDGSVLAKVNIQRQTIEPVKLPAGVTASGIARWSDGFVVKQGTQLVYLDNSLTTVVKRVETGVENNQDIAYHNNKAYLLRWTESENNNSIIEVDGNTGATLNTWGAPFTDSDGMQYELEGMDFMNGTPIVLFNTWSSHNDIAYLAW